MSILANDAAGECFKYAMLVFPSLCFLTDYANHTHQLIRVQ